MKLPFTDFNISVLLKEVGFNWKVTAHFEVAKNTTTDHDSNWLDDWNAPPDVGMKVRTKYYSRPSLALAATWLREVKGLHVSVYPSHDMSKWHCRIHTVDGWEQVIGALKSHDESHAAGIKRACEILKEKCD